ncbi:hypothetical protein [Streptomyces sp. NPDC047028]|uniref:hypothetical protein n=1 Tax=Streptomyces sp. NPDC047028 TaxID=3155793 RepID=UPI0033D21046
MGVRPSDSGKSLTTTAQLPTDIGWLQLTSIPLGQNKLTVRHDGVTRSQLTNTSGSGSATWTAQFPGNHGAITVNGQSRTAQTTTVDGKTFSYVTVTVPAGQSATAQVTG